MNCKDTHSQDDEIHKLVEASPISIADLTVDGDSESELMTAKPLTDGDSEPSVISAKPLPSQGQDLRLSAAPGEVLISYRPYASIEKWLQYRFSAWSSYKTWFAIILFVMFFFFGGMGFVLRAIIALLIGKIGASGAAAVVAAQHQLLWSVFGFLGLAFSTGAITYLCQPTYLGISARGLRFHWKRKLGNFCGTLISWDKLSNIYILRPSGKTTPHDYRICFQNGSTTELNLRLGAIPTLEARQQLLQAIDDWAPSVACSADVLEVLTPPQDHSYTELWMQALTAPPKRERLTPLAEGTQLQQGRYCVVKQLGVGGQGTAYSALAGGQENASPQLVVLKESILPVYVDVSIRKQALEKFQDEAAMLRSLDHEQVVKLLDFFVEDHRSYLVLEHIDGMSLRQGVQNQGAMPEARVRQLALQMCSILSYLHGLVPPVVHRDFTPDNLILNADGTLKLIDFTVAQQSESGATGTVVGKHAYLPPEQFRGKPTPQSDIYALGATIYFLVTGEDPQPITASHPIIINEAISGAFDETVARATALDPSKRYRNVAALKADLADRDALLLIGDEQGII